MTTEVTLTYKLLKELIDWREDFIKQYLYSAEFKDNLREDSLDLLLYHDFDYEIIREDGEYYYILLTFEINSRLA